MNTRIKKIRKHFDLTQTDFAQRIGMKQNSIALIESGARNVSNPVIVSICREFNVNEQWLRTGEGEMFNPLDEDEQLAAFMGKVVASKPQSFQKRLFAALSKLTTEDWEHLADMAQRVAAASQDSVDVSAENSPGDSESG